MQSMVVDILNDKVLKLLQDLETLQLIRLHDSLDSRSSINWSSKYKGAMTRQSLEDIDNQLNEMRKEWQRDF